jgi:hypothetical protein
MSSKCTQNIMVGGGDRQVLSAMKVTTTDEGAISRSEDRPKEEPSSNSLRKLHAESIAQGGVR